MALANGPEINYFGKLPESERLLIAHDLVKKGISKLQDPDLVGSLEISRSGSNYVLRAVQQVVELDADPPRVVQKSAEVFYPGGNFHYAEKDRVSSDQFVPTYQSRDNTDASRRIALMLNPFPSSHEL